MTKRVEPPPRTAAIIEIQQQWGNITANRYILLDAKVFEHDDCKDINLHKFIDKELHFTLDAAKVQAYAKGYSYWMYKGRRLKFRETRDAKKLKLESTGHIYRSPEGF